MRIGLIWLTIRIIKGKKFLDCGCYLRKKESTQCSMLTRVSQYYSKLSFTLFEIALHNWAWRDLRCIRCSIAGSNLAWNKCIVL
jgi:hypothetical protein